MAPLSSWDLPSQEDRQRGLDLLSRGAVGCLVVAGGQATRLASSIPKGMTPITLVRHKTLFQLLAEKTQAASRQAGTPLPLAIMTSVDNHEATVAYFEEKALFGLDRGQLTFFCQESLPCLDQHGNELVGADGRAIKLPAGNGWSLKHFYEQGIWGEWRKRGVEYAAFILIDNPLADPFDAALVGYHARKGGDVVLKGTWREDPLEKVGVVVEEEGRVAVVEYHDLPPEQAKARFTDGSLKHPCANLSLFSFRMNWIEDCQKGCVWSMMPPHAVYKPLQAGGDLKGWKSEFYIFDLLKWAEDVHVLIYPRQECFAPLKEQNGPNGIQAVQKALLAADRRAFRSVSGIEPPQGILFELPPEFHYPSPKLMKDWHGKNMPPSNDADMQQPDTNAAV